MRGQIVKELANNQVILAEDGQCDSPGKCTKYLSYYLMDSVSNCIVHIEIFDKTMVGGKSCNMEVEALKKSIEKVTQLLNVMEVATDRYLIHCD